MEVKRDVVVCPACKGVGQTYKLNQNGTPYMYHGKPLLEPCAMCNGEGRLIRQTTIELFQIPTTIVDSEPQPEKSGLINSIKSKFKK